MSTGFFLLHRLVYLLGLTTILSFVWNWTSLKSLDITVERRTRRVRVGDNVEERIRVRNLSVLPKPTLEIEDLTDLPGHSSGMAVSLPTRGYRTWRTLTPARKRGIYTMGPVRVSNTDAFGLFQREELFCDTEPLTVYPRTFDLPRFAIPTAYLSSESSGRKRSHVLTPHAASVREYAFGDSISRVHWNSTARMGRLMSKEFDLGLSSDVWLFVDLGRDAQAGELEESTDEYAVSIAASIAKKCLEAQLPLGLIAHGDQRYFLPADTGVGQFDRVLELLAMSKAEGAVPLGRALLSEERLWGYQSSLVVITPSHRADWVTALKALTGRHLRATVILVDASSFGGHFNTLDVVPELYAANITPYVVKKGHDIPVALSRPYTTSDIEVTEQQEGAKSRGVSGDGVAALSPTREESLAPTVTDRLQSWFTRFSPSQGWATFAFLMATLVVVAGSVKEADWAETPGLLSVLLWSAAAGLLLAKVRAPALLLHPLGLGLGFVVVVWQTSSLIKDQPLVQQVQELWSRLRLWYEAASSGGISTDLIPFTLTLLAMAWLLGYISSWFIFRRGNVWVAVVVAGVAILTNLNFLPDRFGSRFFLFTFFAMLLVVRTRIIQNHDVWRKAGIKFNPISSWLTIYATVWFSILVLLLAAFLPMKTVMNSQMASVWNAGRAPFVHLEDLLDRMFAAIPARKHDGGSSFGRTLPFRGAVSFGGEIVFWANTDYPSYWLSQTYSIYTPRGWIAGKTGAREFGPDTPQPRETSLKREPVTQSLRVNSSTSDFLSGGSIDWVSRNAILETLEPMRFEIDLRDSSADGPLPDDVRHLAENLRERPDLPGGKPFDLYVASILPSDLRLISARLGSNAAVILERKGPVAPEIVSWRFADTVPADSSYTMVSSVSVATNDELRAAGTDYDGFIKDHYLQLPPELPQRVRDLAERLTKNAETPLDKALIIQTYLIGPNFVYSLKIDAPPPKADGVDHFLFETKTAYSAYFASSMAVMLRAVGVPTRMAAGYAPGEYDIEDATTVVRDSDRHGWVQVYFPRYGWIDFEPTAKILSHERQFHTGRDPESTADRSGEPGFRPGFEDFFQQFLEDELGPGDFAGSTNPGSRRSPIRLLIPIAIAAGAIASIWLIIQAIWSRGLSNAAPVERAYTKMSRLGTLAGIRRSSHQTPAEYAADIGHALPSTASAARRIAWAFANDRYGRRQLEEREQRELEQAWTRIRGSLLTRALKRIIPIRVKPRR